MENIKDIQIEALITANEYLFNLKAGIEKVVSFFEGGEYGNGCALIPLIADGIEYISEMVRLTDDVLDKCKDVENLNGFLGEIVEAIDSEDFVLVGDLFNYEVLPIVEDIHSKIISKVAN
ncbi:hypothetical protein SAMN02745163_00227 [Clostridium cavendishii DSM 21758]|uniref:DUF8042 domain-containing protein n=1 Tax=Clostridium cavendishii DSM 21758 TaxID=1121302 RepID=A0A1M6B0V8_9CLOT|nr:hypothetical protein [Clostridium cavendishii]SHI42352.1 hypothetical protein SAMN02745163_00227 [Clostridium cavendishii DSM 21758]